MKVKVLIWILTFLFISIISTIAGCVMVQEGESVLPFIAESLFVACFFSIGLCKKWDKRNLKKMKSKMAAMTAFCVENTFTDKTFEYNGKLYDYNAYFNEKYSEFEKNPSLLRIGYTDRIKKKHLNAIESVELDALIICLRKKFSKKTLSTFMKPEHLEMSMYEICTKESDVPTQAEIQEENENHNGNEQVNDERTPISKSDMPPYCQKCGAKIMDDSIYCSKCGTKIEV